MVIFCLSVVCSLGIARERERGRERGEKREGGFGATGHFTRNMY